MVKKERKFKRLVNSSWIHYWDRCGNTIPKNSIARECYNDLVSINTNTLEPDAKGVQIDIKSLLKAFPKIKTLEVCFEQ